MKKLVLILSLLLSSSAAFCQGTKKEEATEFAKQIVKTYFDFDCVSYIKLWNDSIRMVNPYNDTLISASTIFSDTSKICRRFNRVRFDSSYTHKQYIEEYEIRIYSKEEMLNADSLVRNGEDSMLAGIFQLYGKEYPENTYFFSGWFRKNYADKIKDGIITSDELDEQKITHFRSWVLLIGKTPSGWKIVGTLP